ncbi:DUF6745 domain-containing protein [Pseudothauera rhizosphaerae]|uniref:DUF6745 domain-containing protein n=1 Tax=Pseudothauera rhizosphaerae TaxID=2565932 RepID=UPI001B3B21AB|nr:hypothetical protein [Pseudothauera rhizosphaerae]
MTNIVRTPRKALGGITEAEKVVLDAHAAKWTTNALRTDPVDPDRLVPAIKSLYAAADMKAPRVVIVPSPVVMAFAGGFAAAILWARKNNAKALRDGLAFGSATGAATYAATYAATEAATGAATYAATDAATYAATEAATRAATRAATDAATYAATEAATEAATRAATYAATYAATEAATGAATYAATEAATRAATYAATDERFASLALAIGAEFGANPVFMLRCASNWSRMYQGGNMWSAWACYLAAFRDVIGLVLPEHEKFSAWESCAIEGGFRVMHEEFCIVSDRPEIIKIDAENRPHCENGPSHRWRDGWALYHWHGVSIPGEWVTGNPPSAKDALTWPNIEQRRAACEIVGWANILRELDARVIDEDGDPEIGTLVEAHIPDSGPERFLVVRCGTGRQFALPVPREMKTAIQSNAWTYGLNPAEFTPEVRT